jgi:hypothetical protein
MTRAFLAPLLLSGGWLLALPALAVEAPVGKENKEASHPEKHSQTAPRAWVPYIPPAPDRPIPRRTVPAATRGWVFEEATALPTVTLWVPLHVARTVKAQPTLYWHLTETSAHAVVLTLITQERTAPFLEHVLPGPVPGGLHALPLSAHGVQLEVGKTYEWSVSLRENPQLPAASDIVARGFIERVSLRPEWQPSADDPLNQARAYAAAGIWYEALAVLSEALSTTSGQQHSVLCQARAQLLEQVGLEAFEK